MHTIRLVHGMTLARFEIEFGLGSDTVQKFSETITKKLLLPGGLLKCPQPPYAGTLRLCDGLNASFSTCRYPSDLT